MGFFTLISKMIVKTHLKNNLNSAHIKSKKDAYFLRNTTENL